MTAATPLYIVMCYWPKTVTRDACWHPAEADTTREAAFDAAKDHLDRGWCAGANRVQILRLSEHGTYRDVTAEFMAERMTPKTCPDCDAIDDECACLSNAEFQRREAYRAGHFA